jgi:hypothetical protein
MPYCIGWAGAGIGGCMPIGAIMTGCGDISTMGIGAIMTGCGDISTTGMGAIMTGCGDISSTGYGCGRYTGAIGLPIGATGSCLQHQ